MLRTLSTGMHRVRTLLIAVAALLAIPAAANASTLTAAQLGDLDQLGNNSGGFDLGDFLAWVQATGAPLTTQQRTLVSALGRKGASR